MKTLTHIALSLLLINSCRQSDKKIVHSENNKIWTQDRIKKYFKDSIAYRMYNGQMGQGGSLNNFDTFSKYILAGIKAKNITDPFILGFEENYIDTTKIDNTKKWFRISVDPVFRIPYCLILEKVADRSILTLKMTNGYGGYYSGYLDFVSTKQYDDNLYSSVSKKLHQLDFWKVARDTTCRGGLDGEGWTFEAIENGQYNIQTRWVPLNCGNSITRQLALIGVQLRDSSQFKDYLHVRTGMDKKEIDKWYPDK
jgi:hypothetical protein